GTRSTSCSAIVRSAAAGSSVDAFFDSTAMEPLPPNEILRGVAGSGFPSGPSKEKSDVASAPTTRETLGMTVLPKRSEAGLSSGVAGRATMATPPSAGLFFIRWRRDRQLIFRNGWVLL